MISSGLINLHQLLESPDLIKPFEEQSLRGLMMATEHISRMHMCVCVCVHILLPILSSGNRYPVPLLQVHTVCKPSYATQAVPSYTRYTESSHYQDCLYPTPI